MTKNDIIVGRKYRHEKNPCIYLGIGRFNPSTKQYIDKELIVYKADGKIDLISSTFHFNHGVIGGIFEGSDWSWKKIHLIEEKIKPAGHRFIKKHKKKKETLSGKEYISVVYP